MPTPATFRVTCKQCEESVVLEGRYRINDWKTSHFKNKHAGKHAWHFEEAPIASPTS